MKKRFRNKATKREVEIVRRESANGYTEVVIILSDGTRWNDREFFEQHEKI